MVRVGVPVVPVDWPIRTQSDSGGEPVVAERRMLGLAVAQLLLARHRDAVDVVERGDVVGGGDPGLVELALEQGGVAVEHLADQLAQPGQLQLAPLFGIHGLHLGIPERLVGRAAGRSDDLGPVARHVGPLAKRRSVRPHDTFQT